MQPCPVFTVRYSDPALRIELLISSWAFLFCSLQYPGSISEALIIFWGTPVRGKCIILVWIGNRGRDSYNQKYLLVWDREFKMLGIRFVSCHSPRLDKFTVSFLPLPSSRKIGIDYFCHLKFLGPRRQGIGRDWLLGKNVFQVICPPQMKLQRQDAVLPGTLIATPYFVFSHPFLLSCLFSTSCCHWSWSPTCKWFLC